MINISFERRSQKIKLLKRIVCPFVKTRMQECVFFFFYSDGYFSTTSDIVRRSVSGIFDDPIYHALFQLVAVLSCRNPYNFRTLSDVTVCSCDTVLVLSFSERKKKRSPLSDTVIEGEPQKDHFVRLIQFEMVHQKDETIKIIIKQTFEFSLESRDGKSCLPVTKKNYLETTSTFVFYVCFNGKLFREISFWIFFPERKRRSYLKTFFIPFSE